MKDNNADKSKEKLEGKYMSSVKVGSKGQIVIPKEARELFNIQTGDTLVLLADELIYSKINWVYDREENICEY
ncbi:MAG: AbrB/MazE/SpoVT family DNA-binding protein [Sedimentibacter sp.]|jgi:AbrB family looped-hinge helix DNA binding protein|nr:AbrB/MazE/SpoVT family DNA-binding protein [Sedimentibacter sp.]